MGTKGVIPLVPFLVLLVVALVVWGLVETAPGKAPPKDLPVLLEVQNAADRLEGCLHALARARFSRVIIADRGSTDDTERLVRVWQRTHPEVIYVPVGVPVPDLGPVRIILDATRLEGQDATGRVLDWLGAWRPARQQSDRLDPG